MTSPAIIWIKLEPGQLKAMQIGAVIMSVAALVVACGLDFQFYRGGRTPAGLIFAPTALLCLYHVVVGAKRRFHRWGYARTGAELHVAHGVFVHTETSVAFHRVQHIDIAQGPVERICGVWQLVLNTAGTRNSQIRLPGLSRETAETLRDEIRQHIRVDKE